MQADSTPDPDTLVLVIVGVAEPPSMADDRAALANGTLPRQEVQRITRVIAVLRLRQCNEQNSGDTDLPSIFDALKAIGLKLERHPGTAKAYVVDQVEKIPTQN